MDVVVKKSAKAIGFEDLDVFKRAYAVSLEIHKASLEFPKIEQYALGDQIRRCSKSVCANIAEGFGKQFYSRPEFKRFLTMAIGSSDEMRVWIRYCIDLGYVDPIRGRDWTEEYRVIAKMIAGLHRSIS